MQSCTSTSPLYVPVPTHSSQCTFLQMIYTAGNPHIAGDRQCPACCLPQCSYYPYPVSCHGAAHQELGTLQGSASALCLHEVRRASPASPPPETQCHCHGLHSSSGDESARGASRQRQGPRSLLEAPFMARDHQAHLGQRCLRPSSLGGSPRL
jgi:hypothetical protein